MSSLSLQRLRDGLHNRRVRASVNRRTRAGAMSGVVRIEVKDKAGRVVSDRVYRNLWTDNWREIMAVIFSSGEATRSTTVTNTAGVAASIQAWAANNDVLPPAGTGRGFLLVLGDGNGVAVVPARGDTALARILHTGQPVIPTDSGGTLVWSQAFINGTGSTQTIREAGAHFVTLTGVGNSITMLVMHVATADTAVLAGATVTVTYTLTLP